MKLYTEESVIKLTKAAYTAGNNHNKFIFEIEFKDVNPIELPTEEDIKHKIIKEVFVSWFSNDEYERGFQDGAKWVIEQIKKQK